MLFSSNVVDSVAAPCDVQRAGHDYCRRANPTREDERQKTRTLGASAALTFSLAQRSERRAQLRREQLRVLPHGEVAATVDLVEVGQLGEGATGPGLLGAKDLVREHRDGHRDRDLGAFLIARTDQASSAVLPVDPCRRGGGVRQPVQARSCPARRLALATAWGPCHTTTSRTPSARASTRRGRRANRSGRSPRPAAARPS